MTTAAWLSIDTKAPPPSLDVGHALTKFLLQKLINERMQSLCLKTQRRHRELHLLRISSATAAKPTESHADCKPTHSEKMDRHSFLLHFRPFHDVQTQ